MNLRDRLRMLKAVGVDRARAAQSESIGFGSAGPSSLAGDLSLLTPQTAACPARAGGCLDGYRAVNNAGETFYLESRYPLDHLRGPLPLHAFLSVPDDAFGMMGRLPEGTLVSRALFFDTETTGLAGGSGTYAFLVGLGFFTDDAFVVRQYFLRDYSEEEAMLEALCEEFSRFDLLVSFNGKTFDWPLLETRFRMSRRRPPMTGVPHLDLLHPGRRIWKERLRHCNLTNLEAEVLGVHREGDVPGYLIPQRYFEYLRSGDGAPLLDVVRHNRLDIISLVSLAAWMGRIALDPLCPSPDGELLCGDDLYGLGRLLEARGRLEGAIQCYDAALDRGVHAVSDATLQRQLSAAYKRLREHGNALAIWQAMSQAQPPELYPLVEMAKYYEHISRDLSLAHTVAERALVVAEHRRRLVGGHALREWHEIQHRLARLKRKLRAES